MMELSASAHCAACGTHKSCTYPEGSIAMATILLHTLAYIGWCSILVSTHPKDALKAFPFPQISRLFRKCSDVKLFQDELPPGAPVQQSCSGPIKILLELTILEVGAVERSHKCGQIVELHPRHFKGSLCKSSC